MANKYFKVILVIAFILVTDIALAQGPPPPPPPLPIDGGIIGLLALGIGYAVKKIYDNSKE
jgi:hypothetical protein